MTRGDNRISDRLSRAAQCHPSLRPNCRLRSDPLPMYRGGVGGGGGRSRCVGESSGLVKPSGGVGPGWVSKCRANRYLVEKLLPASHTHRPTLARQSLVPHRFRLRSNAVGTSGQETSPCLPGGPVRHPVVVAVGPVCPGPRCLASLPTLQPRLVGGHPARRQPAAHPTVTACDEDLLDRAGSVLVRLMRPMAAPPVRSAAAGIPSMLAGPAPRRRPSSPAGPA